jgi:hypothetical protein
VQPKSKFLSSNPFSKKRRKTMEKQRIPPTAAKTEAQSMPRRPYAPPKATFVPLKLEERLLGCTKFVIAVCELGEFQS